MSLGKIMLLTLFVLVIFLWFSYSLVTSIKKGKLESYYGENMSPRFKEEPIQFLVALLIYFSIWLLFVYVLYARWPWFSF